MKSIFSYLLIFFVSTSLFAQKDLLELAELAYQNADYNRASTLYERYAQSQKEDGDFLNYGRFQLRSGQCQLLAGDADICMENTKTILIEIQNELPKEKELLAEAYTLLGESQLNLGRNDLALENLQKAESLFEEQNAQQAECLENLGIIYWNNGNLDLANQYHEKALRIRQEIFGKLSVEAADSYNNLGVINLGIDGFRASLYLSRTRGIYEKAYGTDHPKVAFALINLASANADEGNTGDALDLLNKAENIWNNLYQEKPHPSKAFTYSSFGRIYGLEDKWEEAETFQTRALNMYKQLYGEKHPSVANAYFLLGKIKFEEGQWKDAIDIYQQSIYANLYDQNFNKWDELPNLTNYYNADILLSSLISKAKTLEILHVAKSLKPAHLIAALDTYSKCDSLISEIRQIRKNEKDKIRMGQLAKEVYEGAIKVALMLSEQPVGGKKYLEQAFGYCERSKSAVLLEAISETKAQSFAGLPQELLNQEDSLQKEISFLSQQLASKSGEEDEETLKNALFETERAYRSLISNLERDYPQYYSLKYQTKATTGSEVSQALTKEEALLSYFEGEDQLYLFVVSSKGLEVIVKDKAEDYLKKISGLRNAIKYRVPSIFNSSASSLYKDLIPALPSYITTLTIIPDGILGTIPFEGLKSDEDGSYFIEHYDLSYEYSATLFMEKRESPEKEMNHEVLFVAPVDFEPETRMVSLAGTEREVSTIMYFFENNSWESTSLMRQEAKEKALKDLDLQSYGILHFATHGLVHESKPELSRIFLGSSEEEDGLLYSGEIYNLKINADLVTLSACETGLGKLAKGEGIVGLSRSLLYAGAENLIVSLWQVSDQSTSDLMIRLYQEILEGRKDFSASLRQAKLSLLKSENYQDPYYWAPFILIGN